MTISHLCCLLTALVLPLTLLFPLASVDATGEGDEAFIALIYAASGGHMETVVCLLGEGADLQGMDLRHTNCAKPTFGNANVKDTRFADTKLRGADFRPVTGLALRHLKRRNVDSTHPPSLVPETDRGNPQSKPQGEPHD